MKIFQSIFLFVALATMVSCEKKPICISEETVNLGSIKSEVILSDCYDLPLLDRVIIDSDSAWAVYSEGCDSLSKVEIDFEEQTVLGHSIKGKCNLYSERRVTIDQINFKVTYKVIYTQCGLCNKDVTDHNLVVVPKFDPDYIVEFDFQNKY